MAESRRTGPSRAARVVDRLRPCPRRARAPTVRRTERRRLRREADVAKRLLDCVVQRGQASDAAPEPGPHDRRRASAIEGSRSAESQLEPAASGRGLLQRSRDLGHALRRGSADEPHGEVHRLGRGPTERPGQLRTQPVDGPAERSQRVVRQRNRHEQAQVVLSHAPRLSGGRAARRACGASRRWRPARPPRWPDSGWARRTRSCDRAAPAARRGPA